MRAALRCSPAIAALLAAACAGPAAPPSGAAAGDPLQVAAGDVHVLVFTSHECPIANAYAPTLRELAATWRGAPVRLFLVHVDPTFPRAAAERHAAEYELPGTLVLDPSHRLARELGITKTPEAAVLTASGLAYRGRIDDQWRALGSRGQQASVHDLAAAVAAVRAGRPAPPPGGPTVGCLLPEPAVDGR